MNKTTEGVLVAIAAIGLIVGIYTAFYGLGILILVWAWNTLLAGLFGLPALTFMQGIALAIILGAIGSILKVIGKR